MTNWELQKLDDVIEKILGGGTPSKENNRFWNGSIPWASVKDLTNFNPERTQDYITKDGLNNSSSRLIEAGTLITPTRMALGFTVQFDVGVAINQDLKAIYPSEKINKSFLKYWFESNRKKIERLGVGSTVAGIQVQELKSLKINLPEKPEQRRIVAVLEIWDEYLELLDRKITLKEQLKKGLMQQLLTGKKRLPGFTEVWPEVSVGQVSRFVNGYTFLSTSYEETGRYSIVTIANVQNGKLDTLSSKKVNSLPSNISDDQVLKLGDLLISMTGNVGRVCIVNTNDNLLNQRVGKVVADENKIASDYLYYVLLQNRFLAKMVELAQGGAQDNLSSKDIKNFKFNLPPSYEQRSISVAIKCISDELLTLNKLRLGRHLQKKYLLKNLISGTIRTPENLHIKGAN